MNQATEKRFYEWTVRIAFSQHETPQRFTVLVFLSHVPNDPNDWLTSPSLVGSYASYSSTFPGRPPRNPDAKSEAFIALNDAISNRPELGGLNPSVVGPFLEKELKWRVQALDGTPITLKSLEIDILYTVLTLPPGAEFPVPEGKPHHWKMGTGHRGVEAN